MPELVAGSERTDALPGAPRLSRRRTRYLPDRPSSRDDQGPPAMSSPGPGQLGDLRGDRGPAYLRADAGGHPYVDVQPVLGHLRLGHPRDRQRRADASRVTEPRTVLRAGVRLTESGQPLLDAGVRRGRRIVLVSQRELPELRDPRRRPRSPASGRSGRSPRAELPCGSEPDQWRSSDARRGQGDMAVRTLRAFLNDRDSPGRPSEPECLPQGGPLTVQQESPPR